MGAGLERAAADAFRIRLACWDDLMVGSLDAVDVVVADAVKARETRVERHSAICEDVGCWRCCWLLLANQCS